MLVKVGPVLRGGKSTVDRWKIPSQRLEIRKHFMLWWRRVIIGRDHGPSGVPPTPPTPTPTPTHPHPPTPTHPHPPPPTHPHPPHPHPPPPPTPTPHPHPHPHPPYAATFRIPDWNWDTCIFGIDYKYFYHTVVILIVLAVLPQYNVVVHATGPIAIPSIQAASTTNTIHRG